MIDNLKENISNILSNLHFLYEAVDQKKPNEEILELINKVLKNFKQDNFVTNHTEFAGSFFKFYSLTCKIKKKKDRTEIKNILGNIVSDIVVLNNKLINKSDEKDFSIFLRKRRVMKEFECLKVGPNFFLKNNPFNIFSSRIDLVNEIVSQKNDWFIKIDEMELSQKLKRKLQTNYLKGFGKVVVQISRKHTKTELPFSCFKQTEEGLKVCHGLYKEKRTDSV